MRDQLTDLTEAEADADAASRGAASRRVKKGCARLLAALRRNHPEHAPRVGRHLRHRAPRRPAA
jgi:hypothetical protein